jgi:dTMP kinase
MYLAIEGIDRAGKSTQIELLRQRFAEALFTKEPGGTPFGQKIREMILHQKDLDPKSELFLFLADRARHAREVIAPNKERLIISDRSFISGIAYAKAATDLDLDTLFLLNDIALEGRYPDKAVLLWLDPAELERRFGAFELDNIERRGVEYLLRVQDLLKAALFKSGIEYIIIDAKKEPGAIHRQIVEFVKE